MQLLPFKVKRVGVVITGNEVFKGRIKDKFGDYIKGKLKPLGSIINYKAIVPDDENLITKAILEMRDQRSDVVVIFGGISVDPDDVSVEGVIRSGAQIISYGAPVMPGVMCLLARLGDRPVLGAQAAVIFSEATIIDAILPRILAGEILLRDDIVELGHGVLCLNCRVCTYPLCPFCK